MENTVKKFTFLFGLPNGIFKWKYFNECLKVFKKHYENTGYWRPNISDPKKWGLYDKDGNWHPFNRINTHPKIAWYLYGLAIKDDPNMFLPFDKPENFLINSNIFWSWADKNFKLLFTKNITDIHFNNIMKFLDNSWLNGNIAMMLALLYCPKIFPTAIKFNYDFKTGCGTDMDGVDIEVIFPNGIVKNIQVKSGSYKKYSTKTYISGSQNSLNYKLADYYMYSSMKYKDRKSSVIIFHNDPSIEKDENGTVIL